MGSCLRLAFCLVQADSDAGERGAGGGSREKPGHSQQPSMPSRGALGENTILGAAEVVGSTWLERASSRKQEFKSLRPLRIEQGRGEPWGQPSLERSGQSEREGEPQRVSSWHR